MLIFYGVANACPPRTMNKETEYVNHRPLGRTGLQVSEFGLGGVFLQSKVTTPDDVKATVACAAGFFAPPAALH